ncbi:MAG: hypothetical protein GY841_03540 [FCB group bacterium]|nr:hypothetical protein [FCB group bacterium]
MNSFFATTTKSFVAQLFLIIFFVSSIVLAGNPAKTDNSEAIEISFDDGPHVYWQNDTTAIIVYMCNDQIEKKILSGKDTLRFNGLCLDSEIEYKIPTLPPVAGPDIVNDGSRIFVVSDLHGEYQHFLNILKNGGVIDENYHWIWGDGHLVIDGDVTDRGAHVTECLWLIYRLEQEAAAAGGAVHFVLGNHELMVLRGDNRYVNERYLNGICRKTRIRSEDFYGPDLALGRWLRSKNAVIKINGILFVHGGISPEVMTAYPELSRLNKAASRYLDLRSSQLAFNDEARFLFGSLGPFWYRGLFEEREGRYTRLTQVEVEAILTNYDASSLVVGHTPVDTISTLYDKCVYALDVDVPVLGGLEALLWKEGLFYRVKTDGNLILIE